MEILNILIMAVAIGSACSIFLLGVGLAFLLAFRPKLDLSDRWFAFVPLGVGSGLAILGLALAKWAMTLL